MKNLEQLFNKALVIVEDSIGKDKIGKIQRPITINYRAKSRWGKCTTYYNLNLNVIEISYRLLRDEISDDDVLSVIIHEILHACRNGQAHTGAWAAYAAAVNRKYPQYHITRTKSAASIGLEEEQHQLMRQYAIECTGCGHIYYKSKMSKSIQHPEYYRCGRCGHTLKRLF